MLKLNADLLASAVDSWTGAKVQARTEALAAAIVEIWSVPPEHRSSFGRTQEQPKRRVGLADLIGAGALEPGTTVYARTKAHRGRNVDQNSDDETESTKPRSWTPTTRTTSSN